MIPHKFLHDFELLVAAATKRERCPMNFPFGYIRRDAITTLADAGCIRSECFARNFRRVTILVGPHAGARTADPPGHYRAPYKVIGPRPVVTLAKVSHG